MRDAEGGDDRFILYPLAPNIKRVLMLLSLVPHDWRFP
jgi:hypothetical protein